MPMNAHFKEEAQCNPYELKYPANIFIGECRWEEPKGVPVLRASNPNITQWWELYDQKTQRFYYYSAKDFKTIWQKPTSPDAVVVPLAKLQILKQNTNHQNSHNNESFDSGTGGTGNSSSGHVTPSSPSFSSPSHPFGPKLKWGPNSGPPSTTRSITSPSVPILVDASTQTQNPITSKPTMVSRWTQTTNITPTNVRLTRRPGPTKASISNGVQVNNAQQRPSLHHYLLSEKRFARGRHTNQLSMDPDPNEALYDQIHRRQPPPGQRQTDELELYSAQGDFGEFVRGHSHRQALPSSVRSSIKISNNNNNNIVTSNNGQQSSNQMNQNDGIRMSASFTSVDFKRNIAGRSTGRMVNSNVQANRTSSGSSNIADRISLFNQKSTGPIVSTTPSQSSPTPMIIHRTPSSPPGVQHTSSSTPIVANANSRHSTGSGNDPTTNNHLQRYFAQASGQTESPSPQAPSKSYSLTLISQQAGGSIGSSPQQPTTTTTLTTATSPVIGKLGNNLSNLSLTNSSNKSIDSSKNTYYQIPPSSSFETLSGNSSAITPQITRRNTSSKSNKSDSMNTSSQLMDSSTELSRNSGRNLINTLGHSLSVGGPVNMKHNDSITITEEMQNVINFNQQRKAGQVFPNFNDSHMIMLNKSQSMATATNFPLNNNPPMGHKGKENGSKSKKKDKSGTKKAKEPKGSVSPKKTIEKVGVTMSAPPNTSIESFAKECVSRHRKGGIFSKKKTLKSMLTHTKKPLKKPMISTISDTLLVKESVNCFKLIQIFMGDRAVTANSANDEEVANDQTLTDQPCDEKLLVRLINVCVQLVPMRDEVLVQVARQVTQNPSPESEQRGLELMCTLFWYFTASNKLASHLHAFLVGHRNPFTAVVRRKFEQQMHRARYTHSHLFFRKPHSAEEVARVLRCVRAKHCGVFGETLSDALVYNEGTDPKKQLPWPITLLTEALLEPRHQDREGVFRCVGDMDDVHRLKMKIDTTLPTDPNFRELVGYQSSNEKIPKLTDAHDLHVISSTFKLYFRELREAVVPAELYLEALDCAHNPVKACKLLDRLSTINRSSLCYLIRFLQVFSAPDHVRDTKMDDANLSMVWAPNILRSLTPNTVLPGPGSGKALLAAASANSANIYEQTRAEMSLVRTLIQHLDTNNALVQ
ncbi:Rho GTPase activating protein 39 [Blomia tropicalis]|nr:Rho GTPase activating protein 39 [Blomia tropicalis]